MKHAEAFQVVCEAYGYCDELKAQFQELLDIMLPLKGDFTIHTMIQFLEKQEESAKLLLALRSMNGAIEEAIDDYLLMLKSDKTLPPTNPTASSY